MAIVNIDVDKYQKNLCKKLWLSLIKDFYSEPTYRFFSVWFHDTDLIDLIEAAQNVADAIIDGTVVPTNKFKMIVDLGDIHDPKSIRKMLQILRFPKRYTPSVLPNSSTSIFWDANTRIGDITFNPHSYLISELRYTMSQLLKDWYIDEDQWSLTSGATFDRDKTQEQKLLQVEKIFPDLLGVSLGTPLDNIINGTGVPHHCNRIKAVPKNYRKSRFIAIEPAWIGVKSDCVARSIARCLPDWCKVRDQMHNFNLAKIASYDNSLATIDLSAASDSVSRELCARILPTKVMYAIEKVVSWSEFPTFDKWGSVKRKRVYHMISTMGNRVTFPLECLIFSCIVITCARLANVSLTQGNTGVMGDDIICPTPLAPSVISVLECCGFIVNVEKSFYKDEYFRESCGGEFLRGEPVASLYWPRQTLTGSKEDFAILVALQHKFARFPYCNEILTKEIRKIFPKITESHIGSDFMDLWSPYPAITAVYGSYQLSRGTGEKEPSCEMHTTIVTSGGSSAFLPNADRFHYHEFLKNGPTPNGDPILAALGYPAESSKRHFCSVPEQKIVNKKYLI